MRMNGEADGAQEALPAERQDDAAAFVLKALEYVNKAHEMVFMESEQAGTALAKASAMIAEVYTAIYDSRFFNKHMSGEERNWKGKQLLGDFPPGLFRSLVIDGTSFAGSYSREFLSEQFETRKLSPFAREFLRPQTGEDLIGTFNRLFGPWGRERMKDLYAVDRAFALDFAVALGRLREDMKSWDKKLLETEVAKWDRFKTLEQPEYAKRRIEEQLARGRGAPSSLDTDSSRLTDMISETVQSMNKVQQTEFAKATWAKAAAASAPEHVPEHVPALFPRPLLDLPVRPLLDSTNSLPANPVGKTRSFEGNTSYQPHAGALPIPHSPPSAQSNTMHILRLPPTWELRHITSKIDTGPLMSIVIHDDPVARIKSACLIFMEAEHMDRFMHAIAPKGANHRSDAIGDKMPFAKVVVGEPWPSDDEDLLEMRNPKVRARRRLMITGQQLFKRISRSSLRYEVETSGGKGNVERLWLFNYGNATVALASVGVARAVMYHLRNLARNPASGWHGMRVEYCSDTTEKPLKLTTVYQTGPDAEFLRAKGVREFTVSVDRDEPAETAAPLESAMTNPSTVV